MVYMNEFSSVANSIDELSNTVTIKIHMIQKRSYRWMRKNTVKFLIHDDESIGSRTCNESVKVIGWWATLESKPCGVELNHRCPIAGDGSLHRTPSRNRHRQLG